MNLREKSVVSEIVKRFLLILTEILAFNLKTLYFIPLLRCLSAALGYVFLSSLCLRGLVPLCYAFLFVFYRFASG